MINVECKIQVYNGDEYSHDLILENHWNDDKMVVLKVDHHTINVLGEELIAAVKNCMHSGGWH